MNFFPWLLYLLTSTSTVLGLSRRAPPVPGADLCASLASLQLENTTLLEVAYAPARSALNITGSCVPNYINSVSVCRIYGMIETSSSSSVRFEVWMPDTWYGRLLSGGNFALSGCIDYGALDYGSSLNFAAVAADGGHDGFTSGLPFYHRPEVVKDLSYRSVHVASVIGKKVVEAYYGSVPSKSYYTGCSAGGRQAFQSALLYPDDFDGLIAGSPALDWNHFVGSGAIVNSYLKQATDSFIPPPFWPAITREIYNQCDALDGLVDGIIADPDDCDFNPETLLCANGAVGYCLTQAQVDGLRKVYQPINGTDGQLLWPRFDPGAEVDSTWGIPMSGVTPSPTIEWMRYTIYNDSFHSFDNFSVADIEFADTINPGGISTWNGNLSAFRNRGGKLLSYHGLSDPLIPSGNSKRFYDLVTSTLSLPTLDDFMRLFLIPGMFHCTQGGAWTFGQGAIVGPASNIINDTDHNVLLSLVNWVENGVAPDNITGIDSRLLDRVHCRYPHKSMWDGSKWTCV